MLFRITAECFESNRILTVAPDLCHAVLPERVEIRELRHLLAGFVVAPPHPLFLRAAFGELFFQAEFGGNQAADFPTRFFFKARFNGLLNGKHFGHIAVAAALTGCVVRFRAQRIRQQNVGVAARRRHHVVADHDEFEFSLILQHLVRPVAVTVLIDHGVAAGVDDHLDVLRELFRALQGVRPARHFLAAQNRIRPEVHGDRRLHGVLADGEIHRGEGGIAFMRPSVRTGKPHLPQKNRHHRHGARRFFAVGLALRPPALRHEQGLRLRHFTGEIADHVHGNAGNF